MFYLRVNKRNIVGRLPLGREPVQKLKSYNNVIESKKLKRKLKSYNNVIKPEKSYETGAMSLEIYI